MEQFEFMLHDDQGTGLYNALVVGKTVALTITIEGVTVASFTGANELLIRAISFAKDTKTEEELIKLSLELRHA